MDIKSIEAVAVADIAKLQQFVGLGNELATVLELIFPAEAPIIKAVIVGITAIQTVAPDLAKNAQALLTDLNNIKSAVQTPTV